MSSFVLILKREKWFLIVLTLVSFLIRTLFFLGFTSKNNNYRTCWADSAEYDDIALQLSKGKGISFKNYLVEVYYLPEITRTDKNVLDNNRPNFYRVPGYPLFLSVFYWLFGQDPRFALWVQLVLASFIPLLVFCLSFVLFPGNVLVAKISSICAMFYFGFVLYSGLLMTESMFMIFLLLFFIFFLRNFNLFFCNQKISFLSLKQIFLAGIFLGMASMFRPVGHYLIILSIFMLFFSQFNFWIKLKGCFFLLAGWFCIVFWWLLRNWLMTGYIFFHTLPGGHFLYYPASRIMINEYKCNYDEALKIQWNKLEKQIIEKERERNKKLNEIERCLLAEKIANDYCLQHFFSFIKLSIYHMLRVMFFLHIQDLYWLDLKIKTKKFLLNFIWNNFFVWWLYLEIFFLIGFFGYLGLNIFKIRKFGVVLMSLFLIGFSVFIFLANNYLLPELKINPDPFFYLFLISIPFCSFLLFNFGFKEFCSLCKVLPFIGLFILISLANGVIRLRLPVDSFLIVFSSNFWVYLFRQRFVRNLSE